MQKVWEGCERGDKRDAVLLINGCKLRYVDVTSMQECAESCDKVEVVEY